MIRFTTAHLFNIAQPRTRYDNTDDWVYGQSLQKRVAPTSLVLAAPGRASSVNGGKNYPFTPAPKNASVGLLDGPGVQGYQVSGRFNPFADDDSIGRERAPQAVARGAYSAQCGASTLDGDTLHLYPPMYNGTERMKYIFHAAPNATITKANVHYRLRLPEYDILKMKDFDMDDLYYGCGGESDYSGDEYHSAFGELNSPSISSSDSSSYSSSADANTTLTSDTSNTSICTEDDHVRSDEAPSDSAEEGDKPHLIRRARYPPPLRLKDSLRSLENARAYYASSSPITTASLSPSTTSSAAPPSPALGDQTALDVLKDIMCSGGISVRGGTVLGGLVFHSHLGLALTKGTNSDSSTLADSDISGVNTDEDEDEDVLEFRRIQAKIHIAKFGAEVMEASKPNLAVGVRMCMDLLDSEA